MDQLTMEITVITEEENPMLHRTDVRFRVSHAEATPNRLAVRDSLAARLNKSADEVVIRSLDTKFGMRETVGEAKVYQGADFAADVEQEHMLVRNKIGEYEEAAAESEVDEEAAEGTVEEGTEEEPEEEADEAAEEPEADELEAEEGTDEEPAEEAADDEEAETDEAEAGDEDDEPAEEAAADDGDEEETEE